MTPRARPPSIPSALAAFALAFLAGPAVAQVPPDGTWRTFRTEHFRVTHPEGLGEVALRAAERGEAAWDALSRAYGKAPEGTVELLLTDHSDASNGFADLIPWKRITIFARPPVDSFGLIYFEDWLELVIVHELAHIFHLERTGTLGGVARAVFGRIPAAWPVFPQQGIPRWAVEGIATYYESQLTHAGRVRGTYHDMVLRTAVLEDAFETVDQASGESPVWPAGDRPYLYGSRFFDFLLERGGPDGLDAFTEAVSNQWVPYRLNAAGREAFGVSLSDAWDRWEADLRARVVSLSDSLASLHPLTEPLSVGGPERLALYPRSAPDGRWIAWARSDGISDTQLRLARPDGSAARKLARINGVVVPAWLPGGDGLVFDQLELVDPYRIRRDLYRVDLDGEVERLTRGARLGHPHVHPDGRRVVAIQEGEGTNRLVTVELDGGEVRPLTPFRPDVHWSFPRWSPDGGLLAVSRWEVGGFYDVVILDPEGRLVERLGRDRAVDLAPAWSPDGRHLIWSSDRSGVANLYGVEIDPGSGRTGSLRQITNVLTGAFYPEVGGGGEWLYFSRYHAAGWSLERIPFRPGEWFEPFAPDPRFLEGAGDPEGAPEPMVATEEVQVADATAPGDDYSPFPTVWPTYWEPLYQGTQDVGDVDVIGPMVGAYSEGEDLVGRHAWAAWVRVEADRDARVDGSVAYRYAGLGNPVLGLSARQAHDAQGRFIIEREEQPGVADTVYLTERERSAGASVTFLRQRFRSALALTLGGAWVREEDRLLDPRLEPDTMFRLTKPERDLGEGSLTLSFARTRTHPFSISRQDGVAGFVRGRLRWEPSLPDSLDGVLGADGELREVTGRILLYKGFSVFGFSDHVLALRASGGAASGPDADQFHFEVGGASGRSETLTGLGLFGGPGLLFPVRGYPRLRRSGRYAWSASLEYRVPVALVHRGLGLFPLYFDRVSAALFLDAGNAWGPEAGIPRFQNPRGEALVSAGAELMTFVLPLWARSLDLRLGVAFPLREAEGGDFFQESLYLRLGWSF